MRIVIDMQGAQIGALPVRNYALAVSKAIARNRGRHDVILALSGLFPEMLDSISAEFSSLLPKENIRVWHALGPTKGDKSVNQRLRAVAEKMREAFLMELHPDVIVITNVFGDDAIGSLGNANDMIPTAVILSDLLPLAHPNEGLPSSKMGQRWFFRRRMFYLKASFNVFNRKTSFNADSAIDISDCCDDFFQVGEIRKKNKKGFWQKQPLPKPFVTYIGGSDKSVQNALDTLEERFAPQPPLAVSPLLAIEKTAIFAPRRIKILVIKLDHLGDFILAIPAFSKLRARYPHATIHLIAGSWNVEFAEQLGLFDKIFAYDFFKKKSSEPCSIDEGALERLLKSLDKYDIAIDLRRFQDSRFLLVKTNAGLKLGVQTFNDDIDSHIDILVPTAIDVFFKAMPLNKKAISHQMVSLVDALPDDPNDFIAFPEISEKTTREQGAIAIFPKAGVKAREWSARNFIALGDMFLANPQIKKINIYFANQEDAAELGYKPNTRLHVHIGLKFADLTESLSRNELCIANNSGGGHLASYLGVTVIGIYSGHELLNEWGPTFNDSYVIHRAALCAPCHIGDHCPHKFFCLNDISVQDVYKTTLDALGKMEGEPPGNESQESTPKLRFRKNTDLIVTELMDAIAGDVHEFSDQDIIAFADAISKNHPNYPLSPNLISVKPNTLCDCKTSIVKMKGFSNIEEDFRWTEGKEASMEFEWAESTGPTQLRMRFHHIIDERQRITVSLNETEVYEGVLGDKRELICSLPPIAPGHKILKLTLPDARRASKEDNRILAVAFRDFEITTNADNQNRIAS